MALFGLCMTLFLGDISSALATVGIYDRHDQVMAEIQRRVKFRLEHEHSMILTQVENMARQDSGPAGRNGQEPR